MLSSHSEILNDKKPAVFRYSHSLVENQPLVGGSMLFAVFNDVYSHKFETPAVLAAAALSLYTVCLWICFSPEATLKYFPVVKHDHGKDLS